MSQPNDKAKSKYFGKSIDSLRVERRYISTGAELPSESNVPILSERAEVRIRSEMLPHIIAHRGASQDAPENTLAAYHLAWEQGADGIEGDFHLTVDGRIVCIHDKDTKRVANIARTVRDTTYVELSTLDVGHWKGDVWRGERIPLLEEVLAILPPGKLALLELKTGPEIVEPLARILSDSTVVLNQIVLMSFNAEVVRACKHRLAQFSVLWLTSFKQAEDGTWAPSADDVIATIRQLGADGVGSGNRPEHVDEAFIRSIRAAGINQIHIWTVDDVRDAAHFASLGVTSLITNRPGALRRELRAQ
jgi:glycerophosphoryl diester phosphodiesterase